MQQDQVGYAYWPRLYETFPTYQTLLLDEDGKTLIAVGNSIALAWDEANSELSDEGWRWALAQGFADLEAGKAAKTQCALSITIHPNYLGRGISSLMLKGMKENGRLAGLGRLIAPVRPNLKNQNPLIKMTDYCSWQNEAGLPYDAWLRVHRRLGASMVGVCSKSMRVVSTIADWETWTGLHLPQSGLYLANGGLTPVRINVEKNLGIYVEPNVWMVAPL